MKKSVPGLNIQWPISSLIVSGKKTVETRTYPMPSRLVGKDMALIETPGKSGQFRARIVALVQFGPSYPYKDRNHFKRERSKHMVDESSPWRWLEEKPKWGWPIIKIRVLERPLPAPRRRGIVFTREVEL